MFWYYAVGMFIVRTISFKGLWVLETCMVDSFELAPKDPRQCKRPKPETLNPKAQP